MEGEFFKITAGSPPDGTRLHTREHFLSQVRAARTLLYLDQEERLTGDQHDHPRMGQDHNGRDLNVCGGCPRPYRGHTILCHNLGLPHNGDGGG